MDASQVACLDADSQALDEVLLSDRAFDTDPTKLLIESSDPHKLRFSLIEWLAEAPNRKVKAERKEVNMERMRSSATSRQRSFQCCIVRHTFATERVGLMGIEELRALMGHQNIQTTLRYQKVTSQRAETVAKKAFESLTKK